MSFPLLLACLSVFVYGCAFTGSCHLKLSCIAKIVRSYYYFVVKHKSMFITIQILSFIYIYLGSCWCLCVTLWCWLLAISRALRDRWIREAALFAESLLTTLICTTCTTARTSHLHWKSLKCECTRLPLHLHEAKWRFIPVQNGRRNHTDDGWIIVIA
jgi:hypothetical protein